MFRYFGEIIDLFPRLREIHHQIAVLAFVVALAAYLSNVSRDTLKSLREIEVSKDELPNINTIRKNLAWVAEAEIHFVLLGIITRVRLILGSNWQSITGYSAGAIDNFLLIYLAVIIVNLGILHMRQWYLHSPFKAVVKMDEFERVVCELACRLFLGSCSKIETCVRFKALSMLLAFGARCILLIFKSRGPTD